MRVLFTSWPAWGHLYPMYPLARAAQQAGHEVIFASGPDVTGELQRDGFSTWSVGPTKEQAAASRQDGGRPGDSGTWSQRVVADLAEMFAPASVRRAEELLPVAEAWRPDLVIHGAGDASGPAVASVLGVPSVMHGLSPLPPGFAGLLQPLMSAVEEGLGLVGLSQRVLSGRLLDLTPDSLLPSEYAGSRNRQPLRPSAGEVDADPEVSRAIAALPLDRTVYLTLGTIMNNAPGLMETALKGVLSCEVNVVVTTGPGFDPARLGAQPAHVLVREHIGQRTVLSSCCAVVSHAGAGTMLAALSFGLPQLALPIGADQPFNAAIVERSGAGLRLEPTEVSAGTVTRDLNRLLSTTTFTSSAQSLQYEIAGMPTATEVMKILEREVMATAA